MHEKAQIASYLICHLIITGFRLELFDKLCVCLLEFSSFSFVTLLSLSLSLETTFCD